MRSKLAKDKPSSQSSSPRLSPFAEGISNKAFVWRKLGVIERWGEERTWCPSNSRLVTKRISAITSAKWKSSSPRDDHTSGSPQVHVSKHCRAVDAPVLLVPSVRQVPPPIFR